MLIFDQSRLNSIQNDKVLAMLKLKAFADDKSSFAKMMMSVFDRIENNVEKGENAGYQYFLLFPTMFLNTFFIRDVKSQDYVVKS